MSGQGTTTTKHGGWKRRGALAALACVIVAAGVAGFAGKLGAQEIAPPDGLSADEFQAIQDATGFSAEQIRFDINNDASGSGNELSRYKGFLPPTPEQIDAQEELAKTERAAESVNKQKPAPPREQADPAGENSCGGLIKTAIKAIFGSANGIDCALAWVLNWVMWFSARLLWVAGILLNATLDYTLNFGEFLKKMPIVDIGWHIIRDIANIVFIFIALWSGISITLGIKADKAWTLLAHMVLVALFINFSLFITKAIVDASNIAALHFYRLIDAGAGKTLGNGLSTAFMNGLRIQTLYSPQAAAAGAGSGSIINAVARRDSNAKIELSFVNIALIGAFGSFFMIVAGWVFFAAAIMFIIRAITLMMLMILSPLAFVAMILPGAAGLAKEWWHKLWSQAFFAPLYMALAYVVVATIDSPAYQAWMGNAAHQGGGNAAPGFAAAITGNDPNTIAIIFNFIILIGLMVGCILVAQKLGAGGAGMAMSGWEKIRAGGVGMVKGTGAAFGRGIVRGKYLTAGTSTAGGITRGAGWIAKQVGFKDFGEKLSSRGKAISKGGEAARRKFLDAAEWDKSLGRSWVGNTAIGNWVRGKTTGRLMHAKFGGETTVHEGYETDEKLRERRTEIEKIHAAEQASGRLEVAAEHTQRYAKPDMAAFTDELGNVNATAYAEAMRNYMQTYAPERGDYGAGAAGDAAFLAAQAHHNTAMTNTPARGNYAAGTTGDTQYAQALKDYARAFYEQPGTAFTDHTGARHTLSGTRLAVAQGVITNRKTKADAADKNFREAEGAMYSATNRIATHSFADMTESQIERILKYANFAQVKAFTESKQWTQDEKEHMVRVRWEDEYHGWQNFQKAVGAFEHATREYGALARSGAFTLNQDGSPRDIDADGFILDRPGGTRVQDSMHRPVKPPVAPTPSKQLEHWLRNKTTPAEFVLMSGIMPEIFKIESLVQTMRWGHTHRELRGNENMNYELRNGLSMTKDSKLDALTDEGKPYYLPKNTPAERETALTDPTNGAWKAAEDAARAAKTAALAAGGARAANADREAKMVFDTTFNQTYSARTPADTLRTQRLLSWVSGRAPDEVGNARRKYRTSEQVAMVVTPKILQTIAGRDTEDARAVIQHLMNAHRDERNNVGVMTETARETLKWLVSDPRAKNIPVPDDFRDKSGNMDVQLQNMFRELKRQGIIDGKNIKLAYDLERERHLRVAGVTP